MREVSKMLEELKFKRTTTIKDAKVYSAKITNEKTTISYVFSCCIFKDRYVFTIQDSHGIIELCNFKISTPSNVLKSYINRCISFFTL